MMPIDYDSLKEQPLANILQLMAYQNIAICRYLYHYDDCPLKELFKEHLVGLLGKFVSYIIRVYVYLFRSSKTRHLQCTN